MNRICTIAVAAVLAAAACSTCAQARGTALTRAEVKAETRLLVEARSLTPSSGNTSPYQGRSEKTGKTIEDRQAETLAARQNGDLRRTGDAEALAAEHRVLYGPSTETRADRKAETRAAAKAHRLIPAGEGPDAPGR
jgi:hypothetical protein